MQISKPILYLLAVLLCAQSGFADWERQQSGTLAWLRAVHFLDEDSGWAAGSNGTLLRTSDGGRTWNQSKKFTADNLLDVYFEDANNGWLLCERSGLPGPAGNSYLMRTTDGGAKWERIAFEESTDRLSRLYFTKDGYGFAFGEGGGLWTMLYNKAEWKRRALPVRYLILDAAFVDEFNGVMVGGGGTILFTVDGGVEWEKATMPQSGRSKLNSVDFVDNKTGWAAGVDGRLYQTVNGGRSWTEKQSGTSKNLNSISFIDRDNGFAVGDEGVIISTRDGGETWRQQQIDAKYKLERVIFKNGAGYAVGFGGTILKYNRPQV